jgi:hypothetical protein
MSEENKVNDGASWNFDKEKNKTQKQTAQYTKVEYNIFVKLKAQENPFRVRIASNPKNFRSHWGAFKSISKAPVRSPAYSIDEKVLDIAWSEGDWLPQRRHSCKVFDRDDGNKLKVLEAGDSVFSHFGNWYKATGVNPSSSEGTDWFIWVKNNGGTTEYSATPDIKSSPFTEDEKKILANPPFDLDKVIKIKTPEEIKKMWLQLDDSQKYNPKSKYKAGTTFNKDDFEKRYGKIEEKTTPENNSLKKEDNSLPEQPAKKDPVVKNEPDHINTETDDDQDNLPF